MIIEISVAFVASLVLIGVGLISLVIILIRLSIQSQRSINLLQRDLHSISKELTQLLNSINEFVRTDLHPISQDTSHLLDSLNSLSSDITNKSRSLNFLFKPFHFLNSKLSSNSFAAESNVKGVTISQIVGWLASSIFLFKTTKEFMKNYEKSK